MIVIYDKRLPQKYKEAINTQISSIVWQSFNIPSQNQVYESILHHPDIYFFQLDTNTCICAPCVTDEMHNADIELVKGKENPYGKYPCTARYNAVCVGNILFHNLKYTDPVILKHANKKGLKTVNVSQGYTRCSIVPLNNRAIITQDKGIAKVVKKEGIDVLLVSNGFVCLPHEKHGFLGGATGKMPNGTILFLGDIDLHPDASNIKDFMKDYNVSYISLKNLTLYDAGTLIFF